LPQVDSASPLVLEGMNTRFVLATTATCRWVSVAASIVLVTISGIVSTTLSRRREACESYFPLCILPRRSGGRANLPCVAPYSREIVITSLSSPLHSAISLKSAVWMVQWAGKISSRR
jgi:hypothetical protein